MHTMDHSRLDAPIFLLMDDGAVYRLATPIGPDQVEALVTRDGGEPPVTIPVTIPQ